MRQFKHESEDYEPFVNPIKLKHRPFWVNSDELICFDRDGVSEFSRISKINSLTKEEFKFYQENEAIPPEYKIEDWVK